MFSSSSSSSRSSNIYHKSLEIFTLARRLSDYLNQDLNVLDPHGKEHSHIYISGDIVQQPFALGPHILKAESQYFQEEKHKYGYSALILTHRLYHNCKKLQESPGNGKDYIPMILQEIKRFRKHLRRWLMTL